ncbi:histidinol-phosphatase [Frankia sp. CH37]|nr:histidinol-phosphatase [Parafrankia sp. CH37]
MRLPADSHVHTEWSWDTAVGSMEHSCLRALEVGLPSISFTEHSDFTPWSINERVYARLGEQYRAMVSAEGLLLPPGLDVEGYVAAVEHCRERFPDLVITCGVEIGEPHWHPEKVDALLRAYPFDRVIASSHSVKRHGGYHMVGDLFTEMPPDDVVREYLADVHKMIEADTRFEILGHIDYPVRDWPADTAGPYYPARFRDEYMNVLGALAASGRVLEVNTTVPLHPQIVAWWCDAGGQALSFGSDAHAPERVGAGFTQAAAMAESHGFRGGDDPAGLWTRR